MTTGTLRLVAFVLSLCSQSADVPAVMMTAVMQSMCKHSAIYVRFTAGAELQCRTSHMMTRLTVQGGMKVSEPVRSKSEHLQGVDEDHAARAAALDARVRRRFRRRLEHCRRRAPYNVNSGQQPC